ncbi:hypothetical protein DL93DRAFT_2109950 [Clavulina sp. PMI_390]|nr:hypothetical protein DL93DRAFT_2109950 [Clavulina sp. PMI_390]
MKVLTKEEEDEHYNVVLKGGVKGFAYSSAVAIPASFYLNRVWPYYRRLPLSLKALGVITVTVPACVIKAEWDSLDYEKAQWNDIGLAEMQAEKRLEEQRVAKLDDREKWVDWARQRRYSIVGASWALSMAVAFGIVMRNPYQTFPQKIVQARMWAQGLTVGVLIASAGLATTEAKSARSANRVDHSWALILEQQRREEEQRKAAAARQSTSA